MSSQNIHLYLTSAHDCGYLPDRTATNLVPDPKINMNMTVYSQLIALGYRRSGQYTYRPHCKDCAACVPCRILVNQFKARRNQKRCYARNADLQTSAQIAHYSNEHFDLYQRYINSRHADGDMVDPTPEDFRNFLYSDWSDTFFLESRLNDKLISVAVYDQVADGLSAVYSFFDPEHAQRSLGTFNILSLIKKTQILRRRFVYMGYLIKDCKKMQYKTNFQPLQYFVNNMWVARLTSC